MRILCSSRRMRSREMALNGASFHITPSLFQVRNTRHTLRLVTWGRLGIAHMWLFVHRFYQRSPSLRSEGSGIRSPERYQ